ncbi:hypothetical protein H9W90_02770 [Polaribacter pectinis]|uniref:Uncharacterized protein n=1 Tax=Polaribacter pectinis TaxID=2738844 RepID=A0A7G9LBQ9_9FLAO|nr:DUF6029 family protein [Polaribacter pectinis]QNM86058.1 hypothetical protein H9W90_02770 [Polaribacter pectinis]
MKKILLFTVLLISAISFAQENSFFSVGFESNSQYYLDDEKTGDFLFPERFRSNNYLKVDYGINDFYFGVQLESYEPMALLNYSPGFNKTNLGLYFAGYKTEKLDITLGHFYEQFGNGLILRSWEDRQIGINNALRGARVKYSPTDFIHFTGLYGKQRIGFGVSDGDIYGFNSNINLTSFLKSENSTLNVGFSYVGRSQEKEPSNFEYNKLTNLFSSRLEFSKNNFYVNTEMVSKSKDAVILVNQIKNAKKGNAFLVNFGYSEKGLGIDATFRRMENMNIYSEREASGNVFNEAIVNYLPALTKQHDYLLTNIYVYQAQPQVSFQDPSLIKSGEIGGQIDVFYKIKKGTFLGGKYGTKLAVNTSFWYGLKGENDFQNFDFDNEFLGFGEKYFSDVSLEIRKKWNKSWNSIFYFVNQSYNKRYIEETNGKINANIVVAESTYRMGNGKSLRFEAQHLSTDDDKKNWVGATVEFNITPRLGVYVNDIYNYGNDVASKQIHYYNVGGSYSVGAHRFAVNYGRQRGGLVCVGGVCRFVPESTGISANIIMSF